MSSKIISVKIHKPSISLLSSNRIIKNEKIVHNYLIKKYSKFEYSYSLVCITNLIFNEQCRIVARFKDFLILDDMTEFHRRFYTKKELKRRLNKIFNFYEGYSKIFPNYIILPENKYLYRNIRKKQKMIDAFNQIKKEEEENRNSLKKEEKGEMVIFNKSIQESINRYHPSGTSFLFNSIISGFKKKNNDTDNDSNWNSLISISINKINDKLFNTNNNSFEYENDEAVLTSEKSLVNIVQLLNNKYDNIFNGNANHNQNDHLDNNNKNNENGKSNKIIKTNFEKIKQEKNKINKDTNISNQNKAKNNNKKNEKIIKENTNNNIILNITTPPKTSSPGQNKLVKKHNHQKSALNNNKKFISHKQAVSVSNNNGNNTIKIINNINNIIINDPNINKEMVININTNYFELNNTNLNTFNRINNNNNRNMNNKNVLIKKLIMGKSKNKEKSIKTGKEVVITKKLNHEQKNAINNTLEEKRMHTYSNQILNFENHHYNSNSNNIENSNIINNNFITIHNNTISHINTVKNNKTILRKNKNENRIVKGITEYRSIKINNIRNNGSIAKKKEKYNYLKNEISKKAYTINVENRKSQNKQLKKFEILIGTDSKNNIQNKKTLDILKTDGSLNYNFNSNYIKSNYNVNDLNNNSYSININDKNDYNGIKSSQIRSKLNKKILPRKQKTNSLHINKKNKNNFFSSLNNNYRVSKDLNSMKMNNQGNNNFVKDHIKSVTQVNLEAEAQKNSKILSYKGSKEVSKNKPKKVSAKEMQAKYHKFMLGNKIIHGSYDTSNRFHLFKKFHYLYNNNNANNNSINNTINISHKKILDKKSPFKFNNIFNTPANMLMNKNASNINSFNTIDHSYNNYEKIYKGKIQLHKKEPINDKKRNLFYRINGLKNKIFISDTNNRKMKYVKK